MNVLNIWSSNDKDGGRVNLWKNDRERKAQPVRKVEKREEEAKPNELEDEKVDSKKEVKKDGKAIEVKKDKKTINKSKDISYYDSVPCQGDLYKLFFVAGYFKILKNKSDFIGAILFKLYSSKYLLFLSIDIILKFIFVIIILKRRIICRIIIILKIIIIKMLS